MTVDTDVEIHKLRPAADAFIDWAERFFQFCLILILPLQKSFFNDLFYVLYPLFNLRLNNLTSQKSLLSLDLLVLSIAANGLKILPYSVGHKLLQSSIAFESIETALKVHFDLHLREFYYLF